MCIVSSTEAISGSGTSRFPINLRAHPEAAAAYYTLKEDLAARVTEAEYTEAKSPFIEQVLARAMDGRQG